MSEDTKVHAELRENFGKGFARRLRAAGKINRNRQSRAVVSFGGLFSGLGGMATRL